MIRRIFNAITGRKRKQRPRWYRNTERALVAICIAYILVLFFPHPLFAHSVRIGQFTVHSDRPIAGEIETVIKKATARLSNTPFYDKEKPFHIYIAADGWRRAVLNPRARRAFGASLVFTGNTILNRCDIANDVCINDQPKFNRRPMHAVIAHECTHHLLVDELGIVGYLRLSTWKNEGYCEYISGGPSFDVLQGIELLRNGKSHGSPAFRYLTFGLAAQSCIEERQMGHRQFLLESLDFQTAVDNAID